MLCFKVKMLNDHCCVTFQLPYVKGHSLYHILQQGWTIPKLWSAQDRWRRSILYKPSTHHNGLLWCKLL